MKESTFRRRVVQLLHPYSAFAVENPALPGTPDICCTKGWLELKCLKKWPTRSVGGIVRVAHLTAVQRIWHHHWVKAGGRSFLLLMIDRDILLIHGRDLEQVGNCTKDQLLELARAHWNSLAHMDANLVETLKW